MKYYIYVSDTKVSMLHAQIARSDERTREASLGFDIKLLKGHIKESRGIPENSLTRLDEVVSELHASNFVGSIDESKQYIGGSLSMTWSTYGLGRHMVEESPISFWGYCKHSHDLFECEGTVLALAGSKYHLLGHQRDGHSHSHSLTPNMISWFLENLEDPFDDSEELLRNSRITMVYSKEKHGLSDFDVANGAYLAASQASGGQATYEFVAKVLHRSEWPTGFRSSRATNRVLLGSPLYVAIIE